MHLLSGRSPGTSVFNGPPPEISAFWILPQEEIKAVSQWLAERANEGSSAPHEIGVFVRSAAELDRAFSRSSRRPRGSPTRCSMTMLRPRPAVGFDQHNPSRDIGYQISGDIVKRRAGYAVGVFNGVPDNGLSDASASDHRDYAGRVFLTRSSRMPPAR